MKIYIAGKITVDSEYRAKFGQAAAWLRRRGHVVLNPATLPDGLTQAEYMRICFAMIDCSDAVYFLPDWAESEGAQMEMAYCRKCGKTVLKEG